MSRFTALVTSIFVLAGAAAATGCSHSLAIHRPSDPAVDAAYTAAWISALETEAQDGDIILRRGYAVLSDAIVFLTSGEDISHAAVYDAETRTVIEAVSSGVKETSLDEFVGGAHRVMIVRPAGLTRAARRGVVLRARSAIGVAFDHRGFIGWDDPDRFYCSEFAVWAIRAADRGYEVDRLVIPGQLTRYGEVVFDSGPREEAPARLASR